MTRYASCADHIPRVDDAVDAHARPFVCESDAAPRCETEPRYDDSGSCRLPLWDAYASDPRASDRYNEFRRLVR
jgi:hypothetical protein